MDLHHFHQDIVCAISALIVQLNAMRDGKSYKTGDNCQLRVHKFENPKNGQLNNKNGHPQRTSFPLPDVYQTGRNLAGSISAAPQSGLGQGVSRVRTQKESVFYAVAVGKTPGVYMAWPDCKKQVEGVQFPKYRKFNTLEEAHGFIDQYAKRDRKDDRSKVADFYAVAAGKTPGVYRTWEECREQLEMVGFTKYKRFDTAQEAHDFISEHKRVTKREWAAKFKVMKLKPIAYTVVLRGHQFGCDIEGYVHVYTDGACKNNGRREAKAGIGVWFGPNHSMNVSEPVRGRATNNSAEIEASTRAIEIAKSCGIIKLQVNTDSQFLIQCITEWLPKWQLNGWKVATGEDVKNKLELMELYEAKKGIDVKWMYVRGHHGISGNEGADRLAKQGVNKGEKGVRYVPY